MALEQNFLVHVRYMYSYVLFTCICPLVGGVLRILYPCTSAPLGYGVELSCTIPTVHKVQTVAEQYKFYILAML